MKWWREIRCRLLLPSLDRAPRFPQDGRAILRLPDAAVPDHCWGPRAAGCPRGVRVRAPQRTVSSLESVVRHRPRCPGGGPLAPEFWNGATPRLAVDGCGSGGRGRTLDGCGSPGLKRALCSSEQRRYASGSSWSLLRSSVRILVRGETGSLVAARAMGALVIDFPKQGTKDRHVSLTKARTIETP